VLCLGHHRRDADGRSLRCLPRRRVLGAAIRSTRIHARRLDGSWTGDAAARDDRSAAACRSERSVGAPPDRCGGHRWRGRTRMRGRPAKLRPRLCRGRGTATPVCEPGNAVHESRPAADGLAVSLRGVQPRRGLRRREPLRDRERRLSGRPDPRHVSARSIDARETVPGSAVVTREKNKRRRHSAGSCRLYPRNIRGW
jgi:hypothetical protein